MGITAYMSVSHPNISTLYERSLSIMSAWRMHERYHIHITMQDIQMGTYERSYLTHHNLKCPHRTIWKITPYILLSMISTWGLYETSQFIHHNWRYLHGDCTKDHSLYITIQHIQVGNAWKDHSLDITAKYIHLETAWKITAYIPQPKISTQGTTVQYMKDGTAKLINVSFSATTKTFHQVSLYPQVLDA